MRTDHPLRVLVVDDEPLGRTRIEDLLAHEDGVEVVGTAGDGITAIEAIRTMRPDLVFLDVQMPGKTGLDVVREMGPSVMPVTIFVTAYDQYALQAFDVAAVDYLVKPFDDERFEQALRRARRRITYEEIGQLRDRLLAVLQSPERPHGRAPTGTSATAPSGATAGKQYLEQIPVTLAGQTRLVPAAAIEFIVASGPYARLHTGDKRHIIRASIQALERQLDPDRFMRIHRSGIVRLDLVDSLRRRPGGDYEVQLKSGVRLKVSRSRREALEQKLGMIANYTTPKTTDNENGP